MPKPTETDVLGELASLDFRSNPTVREADCLLVAAICTSLYIGPYGSTFHLSPPTSFEVADAHGRRQVSAELITGGKEFDERPHLILNRSQRAVRIINGYRPSELMTVDERAVTSLIATTIKNIDSWGILPSALRKDRMAAVVHRLDMNEDLLARAIDIAPNIQSHLKDDSSASGN